MLTAVPSAPSRPAAFPGVNVLVLAPEAAARQRLKSALDSDEIILAGACSSVPQALRRIRRTMPDVAVLDVSLRNGNGILGCRRLRAAEPSIRCLFLSRVDDPAIRRATVLAGAAGTVIRQNSAAALLAQVHGAARGECMLDETVKTQLIRDLTTLHSAHTWSACLNLPERRILALAVKGLDDNTIGQWLNLDGATVEQQFRTALTKIGFRPRDPKPGNLHTPSN